MSLWRVLRSVIGSYRSQWRVSGRRKEQRAECTLLSRRTVCKSDASLSTSYKGRTAPRVHSCALARVQLPPRTRDDRDKSNFVSADPAASKSAPIFSPESFPPSLFSRDSPRGANQDTERGIKGDSRVQLSF